jgi:hypothetical protein
MAPVDMLFAVCPELVEEVIQTLPLADTVRIVHKILGRRKVVGRAMLIDCESFSRSAPPLDLLRVLGRIELLQLIV